MRHYWVAIATVVLLALAGCGGNSDIRTPEVHQPTKLASIDTQLGVEYMKQGRDDIAMKKLQHAIDSDPNYAAAYDVLGLLYSKLGESRKAEESFKKALSLDPNNSGMLNNYGLFLCTHGKAEEGQKKFAAAIANPLYRTPDIAYTNAGICAAQQNDAEAADKYFRKALGFNPKMPIALLQMAKLSFADGKYLPARAYLQRYDAVAAPTAESLWLGVRIEKNLGNKDREASYAVSLRGKFPDSDETNLLDKSGD